MFLDDGDLKRVKPWKLEKHSLESESLVPADDSRPRVESRRELRENFLVLERDGKWRCNSRGKIRATGTKSTRRLRRRSALLESPAATHTPAEVGMSFRELI